MRRRIILKQQLLLRLIELTECEAPDFIVKRELARSVLLKESGMAAAVLNGLIAKGIIETYIVEVGRLNDIVEANEISMSPLSEHQQRALDEIKESWTTHDVCLLHGVTSSGKTEVYIHLIKEQLEKGKASVRSLIEVSADE